MGRCVRHYFCCSGCSIQRSRHSMVESAKTRRSHSRQAPIGHCTASGGCSPRCAGVLQSPLTPIVSTPEPAFSVVKKRHRKATLGNANLEQVAPDPMTSHELLDELLKAEFRQRIRNLAAEERLIADARSNALIVVARIGRRASRTALVHDGENDGFGRTARRGRSVRMLAAGSLALPLQPARGTGHRCGG